MWSSKWRKNTVLDVEALIALDLVVTVVQNVKESEEVKILMNMDCQKVWELLTLETFKVSQLSGVGGSIISRIMEQESKSKIKFECVHVKANNNNDNTMENKVLEVILK